MTKRTGKQRLIVNGGYLYASLSMLLAIHFLYPYWDNAANGVVAVGIAALYVIAVVSSFGIMNWIQSAPCFKENANLPTGDRNRANQLI